MRNQSAIMRGKGSCLWRTLICLVALAFVPCMGGCILLMAGRKPMGYDYVLKKGNAKDITEWALTQVDWSPIFDAIGALGEIAALNRRDSQEAVEGYLAIYQKLRAGWPGFTGFGPVLRPREPATEDQRQERLELLITSCYSNAGGFQRNKYIDELYRRIEPPTNEATRHKDWYDAGHNSRGKRSE